MHPGRGTFAMSNRILCHYSTQIKIFIKMIKCSVPQSYSDINETVCEKNKPMPSKCANRAKHNKQTNHVILFFFFF